MKRPDIVVHVEELVLHGVAPADRERVGRVIGGELTRLLIADGLSPTLAQGGNVDRIDAGSFMQPAASTGSRPSEVGVRIARLVHRGLMR